MKLEGGAAKSHRGKSFSRVLAGPMQGCDKYAWQVGWGLKLMWVLVHAIGLGGLLFLDSDLRRQTLAYSWWAAGYYVLFLTVIVQYCCTAGSSPGYLLDAIKEDQEFENRIKAAADGRSRLGGSLSAAEAGRSGRLSYHAAESSRTLGSSSQISRENGGSGHITESSPLLLNSSHLKRDTSSVSDGRHLVRASNSMHLSDGSNWRCRDCHLWQTLRTKHCHDCDKCVLRFDHHCTWLGTCVGQRNHCRFWWYIFLETSLVLWTIVLYIRALGMVVGERWLVEDSFELIVIIALCITECFLVTLLLFHSFLILTNQTTWEMTRRKRIPYLRELPERVHPFSRGLKANVYSFCCAPRTEYPIYSLPSPDELEAMTHRSCFSC